MGAFVFLITTWAALWRMARLEVGHEIEQGGYVGDYDINLFER